MKRLPITGILAASLLAGGCTTLHPANYRTYEIYAPPSGQFRDTPLASGQIVVTGSETAMNIAMGLLPERYSPYIHMGILIIDDGVPYVYEEVGRRSLNFDPEVPPTATIEGTIERVKLDRFVQRYLFVEIFEPGTANRELIAEFARHHYAAGTPFDPFFDYSDAAAFYCAEFVARGLEYGGADTLPLTANRPNRSFAVLMDWLGVPARTIRPDTLVEGSAPVMLVSRYRKSELLAVNEVKRELYRRFTCDQTIGNVFRWNVYRLELRFQTQLFMDRSLAAAKTGPEDELEVRLAVRQIANELYGPFEEPLADVCECVERECVIAEAAAANRP